MTSSFDPASSVLALLRMESFVLNAAGRPINRGGFVPFVDSLAPHFERVEVVAPLSERVAVPEGTPSFAAENVTFRALPDMQGLVRCWRHARRARHLLERWSAGWDLVNLRAPDNFLPIAAPHLRANGIPYYVQMVSHPFDAGETAIRRLRAGLRPLGRLAWRVQHASIRAACAERLCIAHGAALAKVAERFGATACNLPSGSISRAALDPTPRSGPPRELLFVGRVDAEKGLDVLLRSLALLGDLDLRLTIAGWPTGDLDQRLRAQAAALGLAERVQFLGPVARGPELRALYRRADVFVLPSVSEGTPRAISEAMAFGLPVVSTRAGGIPDVVQHGETGLLAGPGDVQELAAALRRVAEDARLRERLVRNATATLDGRTLEAKAEQHVALLTEHAAHLGLATSASREVAA